MGMKVFFTSRLLMSFVFAVTFAASVAHSAKMSARAITVEGEVSVFTTAVAAPAKVSVGLSFSEGDRLKTGPKSFIEIRFESGDKIRLDENSDLTIRTLRRDDSGSSTSIFRLALGRVRSFVARFASSQSKFEYYTKAAIAGVAGTDFVTEVPQENQIRVYVLPKEGFEANDDKNSGEQVCQRSELWTQGKVYVTAFDKVNTTVYINSCFMTTALAGQAPTEPVILPNSLLFGAFSNLPFTQPASTGAASEEQVLEMVAGQVSIPLISQNPVGLSLQNLNPQFNQGAGAATAGAGGGSLSTPGVNAIVSGTITISISQ